MPQMDGIKATKQIRVRCPLTRVLMLSAYESPDYGKRAIEVGANRYVLKVTVGNHLVEGIRTLSAAKHHFSQKIAEIAEKFLLDRNDSEGGLDRGQAE